MEWEGKGDPGIPAQVKGEVWKRVERPVFHFRSMGSLRERATKAAGEASLEHRKRFGPDAGLEVWVESGSPAHWSFLLLL